MLLVSVKYGRPYPPYYKAILAGAKEQLEYEKVCFWRRNEFKKKLQLIRKISRHCHRGACVLLVEHAHGADDLLLFL